MLAKMFSDRVKTIILILIFVIFFLWSGNSGADEDLKIVHEDDKVIYEIENKREHEYKEDKDKTFEILKDLRIDLRDHERDGNR